MKAWITKDEKDNVEFVITDGVTLERYVMIYTSREELGEEALLYVIKACGWKAVGPVRHGELPADWKPEWVAWSVCVDVTK